MAVFQYNFIYKYNQIWPTGGSLPTIAPHHGYFLSYTKKNIRWHHWPRHSWERSSASHLLIHRFYLSKEGGVGPTPPGEKRKTKPAEKVADRSFQGGHLSPYLYFHSLQNSPVGRLSHFVGLLDKFLFRVKTIHPPTPHSRQIQKRPPKSQTLYVFLHSRLSEMMEHFSFF